VQSVENLSNQVLQAEAYFLYIKQHDSSGKLAEQSSEKREIEKVWEWLGSFAEIACRGEGELIYRRAGQKERGSAWQGIATP
jgi:hypothetical protein